MSTPGTGIIAIWHDISEAGLEDFYEWHNREHIPERVAIDGFLRGRRYVGVAATPAYFTLYNIRDPGVLAGPAYHARLNAPTPWTQRAVTYFSNESRSLCAVVVGGGVGSGGVIGTVRFDCDPARDDALIAHLAAQQPAIIGRPGVVAFQAARADLDTSRRRSTEQHGRGDNLVPRWVLLVEGSTAAAVAGALAGPLGGAALRELGVAQVHHGAYQLQHDLVK